MLRGSPAGQGAKHVMQLAGVAGAPPGARTHNAAIAACTHRPAGPVDVPLVRELEALQRQELVARRPRHRRRLAGRGHRLPQEVHFAWPKGVLIQPEAQGGVGVGLAAWLVGAGVGHMCGWVGWGTARPGTRVLLQHRQLHKDNPTCGWWFPSGLPAVPSAVAMQRIHARPRQRHISFDLIASGKKQHCTPGINRGWNRGWAVSACFAHAGRRLARAPGDGRRWLCKPEVRLASRSGHPRKALLLPSCCRRLPGAAGCGRELWAAGA